MELPTPESSSILGLPIVPAATTASRPTGTMRDMPPWTNSTAEAVTLPPSVSLPKRTRDTVALRRTVKFGLDANGV